jgi:hypothetical protein
MPRRLLNMASIVCLVACVALMGSWVRSYDRREGFLVHFTNARVYGVWSVCGHLWFDEFPPEDVATLPEQVCEFMSDPLSNRPEYPREGLSQGRWSALGFQANYRLGDLALAFVIPYWFLMLTTGSLAIAFQLRWPPQFTLRSLFIVTTFLAVVLGMIAWLDRAWIGK